MLSSYTAEEGLEPSVCTGSGLKMLGDPVVRNMGFLF